MPANRAAHDVIALLKADHRKVEDLFEKFEKAKNLAMKKSLATEICTELAVHTIIEEEVFYPACAGKIKGETSHEAYVEHDGAKVLIAEIEGGEPDDEFFSAKVKVLAEMIKHHVGEEERRGKGMFAQARAAGLDMETLGERLAARKRDLLAQFKSKGLPEPETRSFTGHKLQQGEPIAA